MIIAVFYHKNKDWNTKDSLGFYKREIVESCGTDAVFKPDNRKSIRNMILETYKRAHQLRNIKKYDFVRLHNVDSYRDVTWSQNAVSDYIPLEYLENEVKAAFRYVYE